MRIGIFCYDFEHKKTADGLFNLFLNDYIPDCAIAAPKIDLWAKQSRLRLATRDIRYPHPKRICDKLGIDYHVTPHNDSVEIVKKYDLDLGIILGARILSQEVIDEFKIGVLNLHPGLLPQNRGLDTIKWAIVEGLEQGASAHLIDSKIDRGSLILQESIKCNYGDTLVDINVRVQSKEQELLIKSLHAIENGERGTQLEKGVYHNAMPWEIERHLI